MPQSLLMRAASFAHLPGFAAKKRADDDEEAKRGKRGRRATDEHPGEPEEEGDESEARAERGEDDAEGEPEEEGNEDEAKRGKRGKKAAAKDRKDRGDEDGDDGADADDEDEDGDDDSDEEEMRKGKKAAAIRARERARCAAIFASPHAAANVQLAAQLAFRSRLTRSEAVAALKEAGGGAGALATRMNRAGIPRIRGGSDATEAGGGGEAKLAASWDGAFAKIKR